MNYYNLLNVSEDATLKEIKKNYRELSFRYHPDKNPDDQYSEERYKQITDAMKKEKNTIIQKIIH